MGAADRIKNIRNLRNMTTYDLSEITKIPQSTISKIENDKRKIDSDSIIAIAEALDVSIDYLLGTSLGCIVNDYLEKKNIGIEELAENTKIPLNYIKDITNDKILDNPWDWEYLEKIALYLDIPSKKLSDAYLRQVPPSYNGNASDTLEDFKEFITEDISKSKLYEAYKNNPDMQPAVNKLLGLDYKK